MEKILWIRPSGSEIETNDSKEVIAHAKKAGWVRADGSDDELVAETCEDKGEENSSPVLHSRDDAPVYDPGQALSAGKELPEMKAGKVKPKQ